jgi:hypothetical protein
MYTIDQNVHQLETIVRLLEAGDAMRATARANEALTAAAEQQEQYWAHCERRELESASLPGYEDVPW